MSRITPGEPREQVGRRLQRVARQWTLTLGGFVVLWGLCEFLFERGTPQQREIWLGLNLWAAALHYAFDGLIRKLRRPQTAQALGVEIPTAPAAAAR